MQLLFRYCHRAYSSYLVMKVVTWHINRGHCACTSLSTMFHTVIVQRNLFYRVASSHLHTTLVLGTARKGNHDGSRSNVNHVADAPRLTRTETLERASPSPDNCVRREQAVNVHTFQTMINVSRKVHTSVTQNRSIVRRIASPMS